MPITKSGKKVLANMVKTYGAKKGESVFWASQVKGKPGSTKWENITPKSKLAKAKTTYSKEKMVGNLRKRADSLKKSKENKKGKSDKKG